MHSDYRANSLYVSQIQTIVLLHKQQAQASRGRKPSRSIDTFASSIWWETFTQSRWSYRNGDIMGRRFWTCSQKSRGVCYQIQFQCRFLNIDIHFRHVHRHYSATHSALDWALLRHCSSTLYCIYICHHYVCTVSTGIQSTLCKTYPCKTNPNHWTVLICLSTCTST